MLVGSGLETQIASHLIMCHPSLIVLGFMSTAVGTLYDMITPYQGNGRIRDIQKQLPWFARFFIPLCR